MNKMIKACLGLAYSTLIVPDVTTDNQPCYLAYHPELEGCMSHGSTMQEALHNLQEVTELYISTLVDKGLEIPLPQGWKISWDVINPTSEAETFTYMTPTITQPSFCPVN